MVDQQKNTAQDNAIMDQVALLSFVDNLIKEKKDASLKGEDIPQMREALLKQVTNAIHEHLLHLLSDKDTIALDALFKIHPNNDQLDDFLESKIPHIEVEIASALVNFRSAYLYSLKRNK